MSKNGPFLRCGGAVYHGFGSRLSVGGPSWQCTPNRANRACMNAPVRKASRIASNTTYDAGASEVAHWENVDLEADSDEGFLDCTAQGSQVTGKPGRRFRTAAQLSQEGGEESWSVINCIGPWPSIAGEWACNRTDGGTVGLTFLSLTDRLVPR